MRCDEGPLKLITVRSTAFQAKGLKRDSPSPVESMTDQAQPGPSGSEWLEDQEQESTRPDLSAAEIVVSGGRALKSADNFQLMYKLADKLNAAGSML